MVVHDDLRDERPARVAEEHDGQTGVLVADQLGEPIHRRDRGSEAAPPEPPEPRRIAVLLHAGASVPAQVAGVHGVAAGGERVDEGSVASDVLPHAVHELEHGTWPGLRRVDVVDHRDPVRVEELRHGSSLGRLLVRARRNAASTLFNKGNDLC